MSIFNNLSKPWRNLCGATVPVAEFLKSYYIHKPGYCMETKTEIAQHQSLRFSLDFVVSIYLRLPVPLGYLCPWGTQRPYFSESFNSLRGGRLPISIRLSLFRFRLCFDLSPFA
jgi:hypothetical protein